MPDAEARALRRAVVLLLLLSLARWLYAGVAARGPAAPGGGDAADAAAHSIRTRAALEAEESRSRPFDEGETIDPNLAGAEALDRLPGVGPSRARAIVELRAAGVVFRRPEDLRAVRGLGPAAIERIRPYLAFSAPGPGSASSVRGATDPANASAVRPSPVDINRAGPAELVGLPGIGPVIAERVVAARRDRPFSSVEDLGRVQGIGPVTVERLRGLVTVGRRRRRP